MTRPKPIIAPGDVLSYSSGSTNRDPHGFRITQKGGNLLGLIKMRWPALVATFRDRMPIVINTYPAHIGSFDFGVTVDSYLSYTTASRALHLASVEKLPVMLLGQSLYLAHLLFQHTRDGHPMPDTILCGVGGYTTPRSLENALRDVCERHGTTMSMLHGYGVAEVDAAVLLAASRSEKGELLYERRSPDVEVNFTGTNLLLSLKAPDGSYIIERFPTGDQGRAVGENFLVWNPERLNPQVEMLLEGWSVDDWQRRTGYIHYGQQLRFQLRKGVEAKSPIEMEFYDYARQYGHDWLFKPEWNARIASSKSMRRTLI